MIYKLVEFILNNFYFTDERAQCIIIVATQHLNKKGCNDMADYLIAVSRDLEK